MKIKAFLILGDSIVKWVDGWRLRKRIKGTTAARSILGATTTGMIYHTKNCIADCTASIFILHHETNDILTTSSTIEIANSIISLASDTTENVNMVMVLGLTIRNDKWGVKRRK